MTRDDAVGDVVELGAADTHDLRRRVLRTGTPTTDVVWADDDLVSTFHLGVVLDGTPVAVSTWIERRHPDHPALAGFQLRGMATEPELHGRGLGSRLLDEGCRRVRSLGGELVWARARATAIAFYELHGFEVFGRPYHDLTTQLPHRDIVRHL